MLDFKKEHDYLICFDSDGTIMDTMTIKHERSFAPAFLDTFHIDHGKEDILNHWLDINLYTVTRGINRFQGLSEIIVYSHQYGYHFDGEKDFLSWVKNTPKFSEALLKEEIQKAKDPTCLELALAWSKEVNRRIALLPASKSFPGVKECLLEIAKVADLVGVSSANKGAVIEEWDRLGYSPLFKFIACQDVGSKSKIIEEALRNGYGPKKVVMVGDALGDLKAAKENGVYFYPILPQKEAESWKKVYPDAVKKLIQGEFDDDYQAAIKKEFIQYLSK